MVADDNLAFLGGHEDGLDDSTINDYHDCKDTMVSNVLTTFSFAQQGMAQFANWCIMGTVTLTCNCLVQQSL
jgi:hypothetical protein